MGGMMSNARKAERHIIGGVLLSLTVFVLLLLVNIDSQKETTRADTKGTLQVTFSVPFIKTIFFLEFPFQTGRITFGSYGWCYDPPSGPNECFGPVLGYQWDPELIPWLVKAQITTGIACAFSLAALVFLLLEIFGRKSYTLTNPLWFRIAAGLTTITSILAFIFASVLFYNGRKRFDQNGIDARYGAAEWMLLGAAIGAFLSLCVGGPRFTGRHMYRADNQATYSV